MREKYLRKSTRTVHEMHELIRLIFAISVGWLPWIAIIEIGAVIAPSDAPERESMPWYADSGGAPLPSAPHAVLPEAQLKGTGATLSGSTVGVADRSRVKEKETPPPRVDRTLGLIKSSWLGWTLHAAVPSILYADTISLRSEQRV